MPDLLHERRVQAAGRHLLLELEGLQWVSQEYCAAASGVRVQIQNDFKQNPNTEESRRIAVGLGAKLLASIDIQVIQNAEETKALEQALQN